MRYTKEHIKKHPDYYIALILLLLCSGWLLFLFSYNKVLQLGIFIGMTLAYIVAGLLHHRFHHDFYPKIMVEYILIGTLGIAVFALLLAGIL